MAKSLVQRVKEGILLVAAVASIGFASCKFPTLDPDPVNNAPTASLTANPVSGTSPLNSTISLNGSDTDGSVTNYRVEIDKDQNGTIDQVISQSTPIANSPYTFNSNSYVYGQVTDSEGATSSKVKQTITVNNPGLDYVDISGTLEDNESHTGQQGILEIIYSDNMGTHSVDSSNSSIKVGSLDGSRDFSGNSMIDTDSSGNFDITLNQTTDKVTSIKIKAGTGSYNSSSNSPSGSFVRTLTTNPGVWDYGPPKPQTLTLGDNTSLTIRAVPLTTLLNGGVTNAIVTTSSAFKSFFGFENPLVKYNIHNVEVAGYSSDGLSYFTSSQQDVINNYVFPTLDDLITTGIKSDGITKVYNMGLNGSQRQGVNSPLQIDSPYPNTPYTNGTPKNIGLNGWEVVVPNFNLSYPNLGETTEYSSNTNSQTSSINPQATFYFNAIVLKELAHGLIESPDVGNPPGISYQYDSIFDVYSINTPLTLPTKVDKKSTLIIFEETYPDLEDSQNNILGTSF